MKLRSKLSLLTIVSFIFSYAASASEEIQVAGQLTTIESQPGCGVLFIGSLANYQIVSGPSELIGKALKVMVPCAELPRAKYKRGSGDLVDFTVGSLHFLKLSRQRPKNLVHFSDQGLEDIYYLEAASMHELTRASKTKSRQRQQPGTERN
ncbi:hypothetical protein RF679_06060 [Undibacterium cyanobacteriorum]|uniref:Uncharacterized protein n=1 Tax=Undibacterium cyanobacteriorum TaxID=3073561 RepID=A0ABY9RKU4_9BURK|nr:hypothetical protein [Undibacterium sp. 20NA77.5]WMW81845.1 hypothetical protein RF679_06060 [Undibacterium sp. 20NA77.5]